MPKPILIYSGGLDSTVLLWKLKPNIRCLTFNYGQRHSREVNSASSICVGQGVEWTLADTSALAPLLTKGSLSGSNPVPEGHYTEPSMRTTISPNRNMIFLSVAVGHAISVGAAEVYYAAHSGDHAIYPDCREEFVDAFQHAAHEANWESIHILAPFIKYSKAEIVSLGLSLDVPFASTWSCYNGRERACGRCGTCVERLEAFYEAGAEDPLPYEDKLWWRTQVKETMR